MRLKQTFPFHTKTAQKYIFLPLQYAIFALFLRLCCIFRYFCRRNIHDTEMKTDQEKALEALRRPLWRQFHQACQKWQLLEDGDHILIGLSGGKDSLLLTELLARQARIFVPHIRVCAVHVRVRSRNYLADTSYLEAFCRQWEIPFYVRDTDIVGEETKSPCFLCAWYRRKALFDFAQEQHCNKIAFGHHQDDVLHTLLMNLCFEGRSTSIPPRMQMDKMPLQLIRPLWLIREEEIARYATAAGYAPQKVNCRWEDLTNRHRMRQLLEQMEDINPTARQSLLHSLGY